MISNSIKNYLFLVLFICISTLNACQDKKPTQQKEIKAVNQDSLFEELLKNEPFILVTSASHMTRALNFFKQEGLHPIPAPTNHLANGKYLNYTDFFSATALKKSHIIWHEYLGLIWQKLKGI